MVTGYVVTRIGCTQLSINIFPCKLALFNKWFLESKLMFIKQLRAVYSRLILFLRANTLDTKVRHRTPLVLNQFIIFQPRLSGPFS